MSRPLRVAHVTTIDLTLRFLLLRQMRYLRDKGYEVTGISAPGPWVAELEREGFRHIPWHHATRSWNPRSDLLALKELASILRRERFDLVHTHNPKPGIIGRIAAKAAGVPIVVNTVHGLYATPEDRLLKRTVVLSLEALCARLSDLEMYQSEEDLEWARRRRVVRSKRSVLLGNGTDLSEFAPTSVPDDTRIRLRDELGIPRGDVLVGTVGRLVAEKGYKELTESAERIRADTKNVSFLFVGATDPEKADSLNASEMAEARGNATLAGWRPDVRDLMGAMDVFVLPSWREGVPRSAIEAAAMALPLVVTDVRGCREVVRDGVEGFVVPARSPTELVGAINALIDDPDLRKRMGVAARARAETRYDEARVLATISDCYTDLLGHRADVPRGDRVRVAASNDVPLLARLHAESMPTAFLPSLGQPFMRSLYRSLIKDPEATVLVAERDGSRVGFAVGVMSMSRAYRRFLARRGLQGAVLAAPKLLRPSTWKQVLETSAYPRNVTDLPEAELLSIAVAKEVRAKGLGSKLARTLLEEMTSRGASDVKVVVGADNRVANDFYQRVGFVHAATLEIHAGTTSNVWVIRCHSSSLSA